MRPGQYARVDALGRASLCFERLVALLQEALEPSLSIGREHVPQALGRRIARDVAAV